MSIRSVYHSGFIAFEACMDNVAMGNVACGCSCVVYLVVYFWLCDGRGLRANT